MVKRYPRFGLKDAWEYSGFNLEFCPWCALKLVDDGVKEAKEKNPAQPMKFGLDPAGSGVENRCEGAEGAADQTTKIKAKLLAGEAFEILAYCQRKPDGQPVLDKVEQEQELFRCFKVCLYGSMTAHLTSDQSRHLDELVSLARSFLEVFQRVDPEDFPKDKRIKTRHLLVETFATMLKQSGPNPAGPQPDPSAPQPSPAKPAQLSIDDEVECDKFARKGLRSCCAMLEAVNQSQERGQAVARLKEAISWLGHDLWRLKNIAGKDWKEKL